MRGVALPLAWPLGVFEEFMAVGRRNSCSILEAFALVEALTGKKMSWEYLDQNRERDHICYTSDLQKIQAHYASWRLTKSLADIFTETVKALRDL